MTETTVVTRRSRSVSPEKSTEFRFTEKDIPSDSLDKDLLAFRKSAWKAFSEKALPNTKEEAWRRTDLALLDPAQFALVKPEDYLDLPAAPDELLNPLTDKNQGGQIVLYGGSATVTVSKELIKQGVVFSTLEEIQKSNPGLLKKVIGKIVKADEGKFPALVHALAKDGILLYVPKGVKVEQPLHSILWGAGTAKTYLSHVIVVLEDGAEVTYIHEAASPEEASQPAMHAGIVEIHVGENANLAFC